MRQFLWGLLTGVVTCLMVTVLVCTQYSDYRVRAHSDGWLQSFVHSNQKINIERAIQHQQPITPSLQHLNQAHIRVLAQGMLIYQSSINHAIMLLYPVRQGQQIVWHCVGGHAVDTPKKCTSPL